MNPLLALIAALWTIATLGAAPAAYAPNVLPKGHDYFELRDGLANSRRTFERTHAGFPGIKTHDVTQGRLIHRQLGDC